MLLPRAARCAAALQPSACLALALAPKRVSNACVAAFCTADFRVPICVATHWGRCRAEVSAKMQRKLKVVVDTNWMWSADRGNTAKSASLMTNNWQSLSENHPLGLDSCPCPVSRVPSAAFDIILKVVQQPQINSLEWLGTCNEPNRYLRECFRYPLWVGL